MGRKKKEPHSSVDLTDLGLDADARALAPAPPDKPLTSEGKPRQQRRFDKTERERIHSAIVRYDAAGYSQTAIGAILHVTAGYVSKVLKKKRIEWRDRQILDTDKIRNEQLRKIRLVQEIALEAYERSRSSRKISESSATETVAHGGSAPEPAGEDGKPAKKGKAPRPSSGRYGSKERTEQRDGNPQWAAIYLKAVDSENKLLGVEVQQADPAQADTGTIQTQTHHVVVVPKKMDLEEWQQAFTQQTEPKKSGGSLPS